MEHVMDLGVGTSSSQSLRSSYRVTKLDMVASGINMKPLDELNTFHDYTEPLLELMASLPEHETVLLVGHRHSLRGLNLALAMEKFPEKISVAVFYTAIMPDTIHQPSHVIEKGYGSDRRVYIICKKDKAIPENFQSWMTENGGVHEVKELMRADHMPMFSVPQELQDFRVEIADKSA